MCDCDVDGMCAYVCVCDCMAMQRLWDTMALNPADGATCNRMVEVIQATLHMHDETRRAAEAHLVRGRACKGQRRRHFHHQRRSRTPGGQRQRLNRTGALFRLTLCVRRACACQVGVEATAGFSQVVLKVVETATLPEPVRQAASVVFKNFVKVRADC